MKQEETKIGSVNLNFKHYSGVDLYSDGNVENDLLDIVRRYNKEDYQSIIEERHSWPVLYHLSELRGNIVEWIPMDPGAKVLEVGAGCGAITGTLAKKAGEVIACDLSRRRSEINATRNSECDNVTIHVGNFRDIEPDLPDDFDYIFLIGVFEYGQGYIGSDNPYEKFLIMLKKHLKSDGRIVIAIENRLGLKYFAGCVEDHLSTYFSGIEGYSSDSVARTFSRNGLIRIFRKCGMNDYHFYYPYPDYKLMTVLHSDDYYPGYGELQDNVRNYDRDRMVLFNEKHAFESMIEEGMYGEFANSFEVILGPGFDTVYSKYSNDRIDAFKIRTDIVKDAAGQLLIKKYPLTEAAIDHVYNINAAYEGLVDKYRGGKLEINDCQIDEEAGCAVFSFVQGVPLSSLLDKCLDKDDKEGFYGLLGEYVKRIGYNQDYPVSDYDLIFSNILVNGPIWTIIDYEWTYGKCIPVKEQVWRAIYCYRLEDRKREVFDPKPVYDKLGITEQDIRVLLDEEYAFQKYVTGNSLSMVEIWKRIGRRSEVPKEIEGSATGVRADNTVQIYYDEGEGYSEDGSYYPEERYDDNNRITLDIRVSSNCKIVRVDPAFAPCLVTIVGGSWNGEPISDNNLSIDIHPVNGEWISDDSMIFNTGDPNIEFGLTSSKLSIQERNQLVLSLLTTLIPKNSADAIVESVHTEEPKEEPKRGNIFGILSKKFLSKKSEDDIDDDFAEELDDEFKDEE